MPFSLVPFSLSLSLSAPSSSSSPSLPLDSGSVVSVLCRRNWGENCAVSTMDVKVAHGLQLSAVVQHEKIGRRPRAGRFDMSREPQRLRLFVSTRLSSTMTRRRTTAVEVSSSYDKISGWLSNRWPLHHFSFLILLDCALAAFYPPLFLSWRAVSLSLFYFLFFIYFLFIFA